MHKPKMKAHLSFAVVCFSCLAIIQALIEATVLILRFHFHIFRPQDIFRVQFFSAFHWAFGLSKYASLPLILDSHLGSSFADKMALILRLVGSYEIFGVLTAVVCTLIVSTFFKIRKKELGDSKLFHIYFWISLCFWLALNLLCALVPFELNDVFPLFDFLCGLFVIVLFFGLIPIRFLTSPFRIHFSRQWSRSAVTIPLIAGLLPGLIMISSFFRITSMIKPLDSSPAVIENVKQMLTTSANVVLISIDSLRADHLGCYGYFRNTTPNIDQFAKEGVLFKDAFSVTTWTLPSHMSMMTSLYPEASGVVTYEDSLSDEHVTLAEVLQKNGFQTAAFVSGEYVNSRYGFNHGFSLYDDYTIDTSKSNYWMSATSKKLNFQIERWLDQRPSKNFFLFLHYFDVHYDYVPPPPYDRLFDPDYHGTIDGREYQHNPKVGPHMDRRDLEHIIALYDGEIAFTDEYIGRIFSKLKNLGIYDDTLIIVTSDHGEEFFEHGAKGHASTPYEELTHVPLIIKLPASARYPHGITVSGQASILDIMPTVLNFLGRRCAYPLEGQSLLPAIKGSTTLKNRTLYFSFDKTQYALRTDSRKFIEQFDEEFSAPRSSRSLFEKWIGRYGAPTKLFYDLTTDKKEQINLMRKAKDNVITEAFRHLNSLLVWLNHEKTIYDSVPHQSRRESMSPDEEEKEKLKALGYFH